MKKKYRVKIVKCKFPGSSWYREQVGSLITVWDGGDDYFSLLGAEMSKVYKIDCEVIEEIKPGKIPFSWEAYQTGKYDVVTRDNRKINEIYRFDTIAANDNKGEYAQIYAAIEKNVYSYFNNGRYKWFGESDLDLLLIEKQ